MQWKGIYKRLKARTWRMHDDSPMVRYHHFIHRIDNGIASRGSFSHETCNFELTTTHRLDNILDDLDETYVFCKLDFKIGCGIYAWLIRSFQLINLPNIFMGSNKRLLRPSIGKFLLVYYNQMYCKGFNMHVKLIGCILHDDILICCKKSTQHDRRLVYYDGDLRHESLYFQS